MSGALQRSRYNSFVRRGDGWVGYNARTGSFAHLSAAVGEALQSSDPVVQTADTPDLLEMGFLHSGDELQQVIAVYQNGHTNGEVMSLTIAPTLACNKSCTYCYQNEYRIDRVMSPATQDATVRYVRARVEEGWKTVNCTWYGGEPLLAADIVVDLSSRLRQAVEEAGGTLNPMSIITNGTLLDEVMVKRLTDVGITSAQVSFDALVDDGQETRGVHDPDGEPSVILRNVISAAAHLDLNVRINVHRANAKDVPRILEVLREHKLDRLAGLAHTTDLDGEAGCVTGLDGQRSKPAMKSLPLYVVGDKPSAPVKMNPEVMTRPEYARFEENMFPVLSDSPELLVSRLTPRAHFCSATRGAMFVIDPAGDISRCWDSVGVASEAMGNVHQVDSDMAETEVAEKWRAMSPFVYPSCTACPVLPLCMGGCSHPRVFMDAKKSPCESIKFQIRTAVETIGQIIRLPDPNTSAAEV
ncbi:radical SAM protein [Mycolicibacterium sp. 624]|uniref:radical SAM/SPASM domain-containing protein n=1 Tax=Mycolicibacterium sp. 624 TaxID=3156314 RepID=UPI00339376D9